MKLYYSSTSPYVRKVSAVAVELGIRLEIEPVEVHAIPSDYGRVNPVNRVPAVRLDDGTTMFDSRVICEYLDCTRGSPLLPVTGPERWRVLKLQVFGDGILDAGVPRLGELRRPPEQRNPQRLAEYERSMHQTLDALEDEAASGGLEGVNLGTLTIGCALGYLDFRYPDEPWRTGRPALAAWYGAFARRPAMTETVPKAR